MATYTITIIFDNGLQKYQANPSDSNNDIPEAHHGDTFEFVNNTGSSRDVPVTAGLFGTASSIEVPTSGARYTVSSTANYQDYLIGEQVPQTRANASGVPYSATIRVTVTP